MVFRVRYYFLLYIVTVLLPFISAASADDKSCEKLFSAATVARNLHVERERVEHLNESTPQSKKSFQSPAPIAHSFEKEGLFYEEIALWFPGLKSTAKTKFIAAYNKEMALPKGQQRPFLKWLSNIRLSIYLNDLTARKWTKMSTEERFKYLLSLDDPFTVLKISDREFLFEYSIINFDDISAGPLAPKNVTVGDDLGSYEVRSSIGEINRTEYLVRRAEVENYLDGRVGHQHLFHGWPTELSTRTKIGPQYIELLDASTWYLFWRQMNRDPEYSESVLAHPYLGVYTRASLDRLHRAFLNNNPKQFNDKFRMVGARNFTGSKEIPGQDEGKVPDWELRSGNKGLRRDFVEAAIAARLVTGDYTGILDYRQYSFSPSTPIQALAAPFLTKEDIALLKAFEEAHPLMEFNNHTLAKNHVRNKVISPLLPWGERLPLKFKAERLKAEQTKYAQALVAIAKKYLKKISKKRLNSIEIGEIRSDAIEAIEEAIYQFAKATRLDMDFEAYLTPVPTELPNIQVPSHGPLAINELDLGIEYSFRFQNVVIPRKRADAEVLLGQFAKELSKTPVATKDAGAHDDSHGHGMVVKFKSKDEFGDTWRVEWDGIKRYYVDGKVRRAWGGHMEVVSPKFHPTQVENSPIAHLYSTAKKNGFLPKRHAGGAHVSFDLGPIFALPEARGTRAILNLISFFESEREVMLFMWMHPFRTHAARPVQMSPDQLTIFAKNIATFKGSWADLGRMLYNNRYFNTFVGRKPKYVPLNLTSLMTPILPDEYLASPLDIKNNRSAWFPSFNKVTGRGEARFFDAPLDEYMAALQIKYWRAVLNHALNASTNIALRPIYSESDKARWSQSAEAWIKDASLHLKSLGLDPVEYEPLLWDSWHTRNRLQERKRDLTPYDKFLPPKSGPAKYSFLGVLKIAA